MRGLPASVDEYFALPQSDYVESVVLSAGTAQSVSVPAGAKFVMFSSSADFWMKEGSTVAVRGATTTNGSGGELNPYIRKLNSDVRQVSVVAADTCHISIAFYG